MMGDAMRMARRGIAKGVTGVHRPAIMVMGDQPSGSTQNAIQNHRRQAVCTWDAHRLAGLIADPRNPLLVTHSVVDISARMLAIACGYEDADDLDHLRTAPASNWPAGSA